MQIRQHHLLLYAFRIMTQSSSRLVLRHLAVASVALLALAASASAQGRGRGGGGGGGRGGSIPQLPMQRVREELKLSDYFEFLDDKGKQIGLEKAQKDSVKVLSKQMDEQQKPILKEMEKQFENAERSAMQGGRSGGGRGGMPEEVRTLMQNLVAMQEDYATKAHVLLNDSQKHIADSLIVIYQEQLRVRQRNRSRG